MDLKLVNYSLMKDDRSTNDVPIITRLKTYDADELAGFASAQGWNEKYIQLKKGVFGMEMNIVEIGDFQFIEQFSSVPILYRGSSPTATFALTIAVLNIGETLYGGNIVSEDCCLTGNFNGYLDLRTSNPNRLLIITAPIERILARAEQLQRPITKEQLLSPGIMTPNPKALQQLSAYVRELLVLAKKDPYRLTDSSKNPLMSYFIIEDLLPLLLDVLTSQVNFVPEKESSRQKLVKRAEAFMRDRLADPITLTDLCQELNMSQRSLYYAFQECFGLPPMEYLKILRLHGVRQALKSSTSPASKVTKIAGNYGFWHMGQFSQDYKKMFGESPSTTLRKTF